MVACRGQGGGGGGSSAQRHQGDGPDSSFGHLERGHRAVCGGDLVGDFVVEMEAVVEVDSESG